MRTSLLILVLVSSPATASAVEWSNTCLYKGVVLSTGPLAIRVDSAEQRGNGSCAGAREVVSDEHPHGKKRQDLVPNTPLVRFDDSPLDAKQGDQIWVQWSHSSSSWVADTHEWRILTVIPSVRSRVVPMGALAALVCLRLLGWRRRRDSFHKS